jgi:single-strand DNA-binding protein
MASYNEVLLMGNITRDIQLSYTPNQTAVADFGIAVNRKWTAQSGEKKEEVCFVDLRAFGKTAETLNKYVHKGDPIFIQGRLTYDTWTAQDGTKRNKHRVTVTGFQFLASGNGNQQGQQPQGNGGQRQAPPQQAQRQPGWDDDFGPPPSDDSIPF